VSRDVPRTGNRARVDAHTPAPPPRVPVLDTAFAGTIMLLTPSSASIASVKNPLRHRSTQPAARSRDIRHSAGLRLIQCRAGRPGAPRTEGGGAAATQPGRVLGNRSSGRGHEEEPPSPVLGGSAALMGAECGRKAGAVGSGRRTRSLLPGVRMSGTASNALLSTARSWFAWASPGGRSKEGSSASIAHAWLSSRTSP
jgi:hypothetical protein